MGERLKIHINQSENYVRIREYKHWYKHNGRKSGTQFSSRQSIVLKKLTLIRILNLKKYSNGITKEQLSIECNNRNVDIRLSSAYKWAKLYNEGGYNLLLEDKRKGGNRTSVVDRKIAGEIKKWMNKKAGTMNTYTSLKKSLFEKYGKHIPYTTLRHYIKRNFEKVS